MMADRERLEFSGARVLVVKHRVRGTAIVSLRVDTPEGVLIDEGNLTQDPYVTYIAPPAPGVIRCWYSVAGGVGEEFEITADVIQQDVVGKLRQVKFSGAIPEVGHDERLLVLTESFGGSTALHYLDLNITAELIEKLPKDGGKRQIWFATNRKPVEKDGALAGFSADRDSGKVHYGVCWVRVPESHDVGRRGLLARLFAPLEKLQIVGLESLARQQHFTGISKELGALQEDDRHAVVFIHGYNVSFDQAAVRCAQLGADLGLPGITAFFSWPSQGKLRGYFEDEASIEAAERPLTDYLTDFATHSGAANVHIIAHSMGNRALLRAVDRIARNAQSAAGVRFRHIVLAAPDVDQDTFKNLCAGYGRVADRSTLYTSARDRAVEASRWLHGFPRVGLEPPLVVTEGIDTISATNVDVTLLGHGYVNECRPVIADMFALLRNGDPPTRRFGLRTATTPDGSTYWEFRA